MKTEGEIIRHAESYAPHEYMEVAEMAKMYEVTNPELAERLWDICKRKYHLNDVNY